MTVLGTAAYDQRDDLPETVATAVAAANRLGFDTSCSPEQGELLRLLARGAGPGLLGELGTGCGVGLAWIASGADPAAAILGVDHDPRLVAAASRVLATDPRVEILIADWRALARRGPFDLLVLDGGGHGKQGGERIDPAVWLRPGGTLVIDDLTPFGSWPPRYAGRLDSARLHWLEHPDLLTTEVRLTASSSTLVGRYVGSGRADGA
jgi:predicted O-methyltransferase YrrM